MCVLANGSNHLFGWIELSSLRFSNLAQIGQRDASRVYHAKHLLNMVLDRVRSLRQIRARTGDG